MPYALALIANILFSMSSIAYTRFARRHGILWMNLTKSSVALISAWLALSVLRWWTQLPSLSVWPFFASGIFGLALGDIFLISAFARMGSARTMVLWGFQPAFVALGSFIFFGETLNTTKLIAIALLVSCLFSFSFEGFKKRGRWELKGLSYALAGVMLDGVGLFFSRYGFQLNLKIVPLEGHFYRCLGAVVCFLVIKQIFPFKYFRPFVGLKPMDKSTVLMSSFVGTFLAIYLYLTAVQIGHLPSLAALSITTPLFTAMFEHLYERKWPSRLFLFAFVQFLVGFYLLVGYE